jgi:hypothetical protein
LKLWFKGFWKSVLLVLKIGIIFLLWKFCSDWRGFWLRYCVVLSVIVVYSAILTVIAVNLDCDRKSVILAFRSFLLPTFSERKLCPTRKRFMRYSCNSKTCAISNFPRLLLTTIFRKKTLPNFFQKLRGLLYKSVCGDTLT